MKLHNYSFSEYSSAASSSQVSRFSYTSTLRTRRRATSRKQKNIHTKETNAQSLIIFEQVDIKRERVAYSVLVADIMQSLALPRMFLRARRIDHGTHL